ncbi:hypothetical protein KFE25_002985 [Diacronema lutheri]|uniref:Uncharacterized protein n=1 Tax=Diacronema lutheri TaxID=2081491 RepID=A0A8J5XEU5_DIALT|nr:hypothetical protein KFE25_002985 [Diacronema lutheri]
MEADGAELQHTRPSEHEAGLCRVAEDRLREQANNLAELVDNLNEGVYHDARLMLYDEDHGQLQRSMSALGKLQERVRKSAVKLRKLDAERDKLDFGELSEYPRRKHEYRQQRRALNKVNERLTQQLERDANVLAAFRELIERMGARLDYTVLVQEARTTIEVADATAAECAHADRPADGEISDSERWQS